MQKKALALILLCAALPVMMAVVLSPALPALQSEFRGEGDIAVLAKLVLTTPALAIALSAGAIGFLIDRWGRFPILLSALMLFAACGTQGLWADDIVGMIVARFFFGLGVAGIMTTTGTWLADHFEGRMLRRIVGIQAGLMGIWGIAFQIMAGFLAEYSWRYPFILYGTAFFLFIAVATERSLRSEPRPEQKEPQETRVEGVKNLRLVILLALISAAALSLFSLVPVQGPLYFHQTFGLTPRDTALLISTATASSSLASFFLAFWRPTLAPSVAISFGMTSIAIGFGVLILADAWAWLAVSMICIGGGVGIVIPCIHAVVASLAPGRMRGRILGFLLSGNYVGQFLSPLWAQLVLSRFGDRPLFALSAFFAVAISALVSLAPVFAMEPKRREH